MLKSYKQLILEKFGKYLTPKKEDIFEDGVDGCWVYLDEKYIAKSTGGHLVHEDSFRECYKALKEGILEA